MHTFSDVAGRFHVGNYDYPNSMQLNIYCSAIQLFEERWWLAGSYLQIRM